MERKIGETFEYEGKKLKVMANRVDTCEACFFDGHCTRDNKALAGKCGSNDRDDGKNVIFVEVQEQPQKEQPKLNLCEILKHCPKGWEFWSPMLGDVALYDIDNEKKRVYILLKTNNDIQMYINADATLTLGDVTSPEIMLYPSREQRDWTKVKYEQKKELPKTWEEFCENYPTGEAEYFFNTYSKVRKTKSGVKRSEVFDRNILPSKQAAEAHLALMQLHQLRDAWREGWLPDWKDSAQTKYAIYNLAGRFTLGLYTETRQFLAFQDKKRADEFKNCFIDLIKQAGDLI